jgi:hypothetical protein
MSKTMLFIDTEFNGLNGKLISMALTGEYEGEVYDFYEVIELEEWLVIDPWVKENVIPVLNNGGDRVCHTKPIKYQEFQDNLRSFLRRFSDGFIVIADWPCDIRHFCEALITGPGEMLNIPSFEVKVEIIESLSTAALSKVPHNALEDARALRKELLERHEYKLC